MPRCFNQLTRVITSGGMKKKMNSKLIKTSPNSFCIVENQNHVWRWEDSSNSHKSWPFLHEKCCRKINGETAVWCWYKKMKFLIDLKWTLWGKNDRDMCQPVKCIYGGKQAIKNKYIWADLYFSSHKPDLKYLLNIILMNFILMNCCCKLQVYQGFNTCFYVSGKEIFFKLVSVFDSKILH